MPDASELISEQEFDEFTVLRKGKRDHADCRKDTLYEADEFPIGTIVRCMCGKRWKVSSVWIIGGPREAQWRRKWLPWG